LNYTSIEICAGAGGQALGLEQAGFQHIALVEIEPVACDTLRLNRPEWNVINKDVKDFIAKDYKGVDLFAGGVPCPHSQSPANNSDILMKGTCSLKQLGLLSAIRNKPIITLEHFAITNSLVSG
jgi:site-specific DNA-cytosine methylase